MKTGTRNVTVIIVTYRSRETIGEALEALKDGDSGGVFDCVVVDNAGDDGTAEFVGERYTWVRLIRSSENLGFGSGCNLAFSQVQTPYILLLNPDAVITPAAIQQLINVMESQPGAAVVAPAIVEADGSLQQAGLLTTAGSLLRSSLGSAAPFPDARSIVPEDLPFETTWVCGAVMLIRSESFREVGGFDPRFFLYFEETDLCRRLSQMGAGIWATGSSVARHRSGHSARRTDMNLVSSCVSSYYFQSRARYLRKYYGRVVAGLLECVIRVGDSLRRIRRRRRNRRDAAAAETMTSGNKAKRVHSESAR